MIKEQRIGTAPLPPVVEYFFFVALLLWEDPHRCASSTDSSDFFSQGVEPNGFAKSPPQDVMVSKSGL